MFNNKEFDREIDCLKANLGIFAYELEQSENMLEYIQNNDDYKFLIDKPDKGYTIRIHLSSSMNKKVLQRIDVKHRADFLYKKYISLAKKYSEDNVLSPFEPLDFVANMRKTLNRDRIFQKLEVLREILGYSYDKIKYDIERAE